jgi:hypothetical protein
MAALAPGLLTMSGIVGESGRVAPTTTLLQVLRCRRQFSKKG